MRRARVGRDPDAAPQQVILPAAWGEPAAAALAALAPPEGPASLAAAADAWIRPLAARARGGAGTVPLEERLHALLLLRRGAPTPDIWRGAPAGTPGFVLNLASFADPALGFDVAGFAEAAETAATALALAVPAAPRLAVAVADLAGLLARLGIDYASAEAREVGAAIAALLRGRVDATLAESGTWPAPPAAGAVPGLAAAAREARARAQGTPRLPLGDGICRAATTAILVPGPAEALLGVETGGIAPAFSPLDAEGRLTRAARAYLAARGLSAEDALAAALCGQAPLPLADAAAHRAMHEAVAPFLHAMPALPDPREAPRAWPMPLRRELPARHGGYAQRAAVGGHRVYLRTGEYADGALGEITLALPKEGAVARGLADGVAAAISLGLQHGVPLEAFVDALGLTRFGPAGEVEGDPSVAQATSLLDYVARHLSASYLGRPLPAPPAEAWEDRAPPLPLELPRHEPARPLLRVVGAAAIR